MKNKKIKFVVQPHLTTTVSINNNNGTVSLHSIRLTNAKVILKNPIIEGIQREEVLVIEPDRIEVVKKINFNKLTYDEIYSVGIFDTKKDLLFDTYDDAIDKVAEICTKYKIPPKDIEDFTHGLLKQSYYLERIQYLFENNPELFI